MSNREKYKFDDFTLTNYKRLIQLAKDKGFCFILHKDEYVVDRKDLIWRHDVEFEPDIALRMAKIEKELGVQTTYFFQLHSEYYNLVDKHYSKVFHQIRELGHHVGLHFDSAYWNITNERDLDKFIAIDRLYLETNLGIEIETFSFHNTTPFTQSCLEYRYGGLINVYASFFKQNYNYCGDSLGYWRFDRLEDVLNNPNVQHLQVLTHDANWSDEVLSPRERLRQTFQLRANNLLQSQVDGLHNKGMKCIADDCE